MFVIIIGLGYFDMFTKQEYGEEKYKNLYTYLETFIIPTSFTIGEMFKLIRSFFPLLY